MYNIQDKGSIVQQDSRTKKENPRSKTLSKNLNFCALSNEIKIKNL